METIEDHEVDATAEAGAPEASLLGKLRRQREEASSHDGTLEIGVPAYSDPELVLIMGYRSFDDMRKVGEKVRKQPKQVRDKYAAADTLAAGVERIVMRDVDTGREVVVSEGFDNTLDTKLELQSDGIARLMVFRTFENDHAMIAAAIKYGKWLQHGGVEVDDSFMGE